jgi:ribosomal protein L40E
MDVPDHIQKKIIGICQYILMKLHEQDYDKALKYASKYLPVYLQKVGQYRRFRRRTRFLQSAIRKIIDNDNPEANKEKAIDITNKFIARMQYEEKVIEKEIEGEKEHKAEEVVVKRSLEPSVKMVSLKICPSCKNVFNPPNAFFCNSCGFDLSSVSPSDYKAMVCSCGHPNLLDAKTCKKCGRSLVKAEVKDKFKICTGCKAENPKSATFCHTCGREF